MSSIAYITDSRMIQLHRLNNHKTMNFWRLSNNVNFSDFTIGDLVFFLSKDKQHLKGKEKGIVGFGKLKNIDVSSAKTMWNKYGILNGYNSFEDFKEAIIKVSKDKQLPKKISSFYLEDVCFFQPVYLSECGVTISTNVESYIYLKPEDVVIKLLEIAKSSKDLWASFDDEEIDKEEILYSLNMIHNKIGDTKSNKKAYKFLKAYVENSDYEFVHNCRNEIYKLDGDELTIMFYIDKDTDLKTILGQVKLYRHYFELKCPKAIKVKFKTTNNDESLYNLLND